MLEMNFTRSHQLFNYPKTKCSKHGKIAKIKIYQRAQRGEEIPAKFKQNDPWLLFLLLDFPCSQHEVGMEIPSEIWEFSPG